MLYTALRAVRAPLRRPIPWILLVFAACGSPAAGKGEASAGSGGGIGLDVAFAKGDAAHDGNPGDAPLGVEAAVEADAQSDEIAADGFKAEAGGGGCDFPTSPLPGESGAACTTATDCQSGYCVDSAEGRVCTQTCVNCCPDGYACKQIAVGSDAALVCLPQLLALCRPCLTDAECGAVNAGALCIPRAGSGSFCGGVCLGAADCPAGYSCETAQGEKGAGKQCVRQQGECGCSPKSILEGASTNCSVENSAGTCEGTRKCKLDGLSACSAGTPAAESCNGLDDDCDGQTDEMGAGGCIAYYSDADGDGSGSGGAKCLCGAVGLFAATTGSDCDDSAKAVHPGASEICNDLDDDCDGQTDEGCDDDGDGWCDAAVVVVGTPVVCPFGQKDCNDGAAAIHPGQLETCGNGKDDDCDGLTDAGATTSGCVVFFQDADGDGYGAGSGVCNCAATGTYTATQTGDCADTDALVHPGTDEICGNGVDDNCSGGQDEAGATGCTAHYADGDGDGYGAANGACLCAANTDYPLTQAGDCDDAKPAVHPGAAEACNAVDDDCDAQTDPPDAAGCSGFFGDGDGDGFGAGLSVCLCAADPAHPVAAAGDCDDAAAAVHPGATEVCNSLDDNCNGETDEAGATCGLHWLDGDGDGFGAGTPLCLCGANAAYTATQGGDCDDGAALVHPSATEACNTIDDDCDGVTDGPGATGCTAFFADVDGDKYGDSGVTACLCVAAGVYTAAGGGDCNDAAATVHPKADEACNGVDDDCDGTTDPAGAEGCSNFYVDTDNDGFGGASLPAKCLCSAASPYLVLLAGDCAELNAAIHPGAGESCNGFDDNCDGVTDPHDVTGCVDTFYDGDGDGYGVAPPQCQCGVEGKWSASGSGDCDDAKSGVHPGAVEVCNGSDDNCDGATDEGGATTFYQDLDSDGYGDPAVSVIACAPPPGWVANGLDCADENADFSPAQTDVCNGFDDNCDGVTDDGGTITTWYADSDGDGWGNKLLLKVACQKPSGYVTDKTDCDDAATTAHPGAAELCNGVDDDCDGEIDNGLMATVYLDGDGDGYGNPYVMKLACDVPSGYSADKTDCADNAAGVHPGAVEACNNVDDNCDGTTDENAMTVTFWADGDGDGYGDAATTTLSCAKPNGFVANSSDCNDASNAIHPGAAESCNGTDDNCNGQTDEGALATYYSDGDGDGYGAPPTTQACSVPANFVTISGDCNDALTAIHPGAPETCNDVDDDCDSQTDEGLKQTWYQDADVDGYGNAAVSTWTCSPATNWVLNGNDCNDADPLVNSSTNAEICNGLDDNCNGQTDEGLALTTFWRDADADTYGDAANSQQLCGPATGWVSNKLDCLDSNVAVHPGVTEVKCNQLDDNCNGTTDEGTTFTTYYQDKDGDGYGNAAVSVSACAKPAGYVTDKTDCNDNDNKINPGIFGGSLQESLGGCNGKDNDCDGYTDNGYAWPWYADGDGDGYGTTATSKSVCIGSLGGAGWTKDGSDCNDSNGAIHPQAAEIACDGIDQDCIAGDDCTTVCTAKTLYDFETGPQGWSQGGGWTWDYQFSPGIFGFPSTYKRTLAYEKDKQNGYAVAATGATTSTTLWIPNNAKFIEVGVDFENTEGTDSSGYEIPDTSAKVVYAINGTVYPAVGPYSSYSGAVKTSKLAIDPAWWMTQVPFTITVTTTMGSPESWSGFFFDNFKVLCN